MIIVDSSVAAKWFFKYEQNAAKAKEILKSHVLGEEGIIVPDFFIYEIANMLASKSAVSPRKTTLALSRIYSMQLKLYHLTEDEVKKAAKMARKYKTSVYDMLYVVVAKLHKTSLITADEQFIKQTGFKFVKIL